MHIAQQLKDAIRKEFKAIVVSLPHRADDSIRKNADLTGRLSLIDRLIINDNLIMYLSNGKSIPDGGCSPFSVVSRRMLTIPVNINICI